MALRKKETKAEVEASARALVNKGVALGELGHHDEAIAVYGEVVGRFETASELTLREQVARALFNKGVTLGALDRSEEAIAVYDDLTRRFETATEPALREQVAKALFHKGVRLGALGRIKEVPAVYDDLRRLAERFNVQDVEDNNQSGYTAEHSRKSIKRGVAGGTETPATTDMQELERRWALLGLPETPSRMWTPRPQGRPPKGVSYNDELIAFIGEVYGVHLKGKSSYDRRQVRSYIYNKDEVLYEAIIRLERYGGKLPPEIDMPSAPRLLEERFQKAVREGLYAMPKPVRRAVSDKLGRIARQEHQPKG